MESVFAKNFTLVLNEDRFYDVVEGGIIFGRTKGFTDTLHHNSKGKLNYLYDKYIDDASSIISAAQFYSVVIGKDKGTYWRHQLNKNNRKVGWRE